MTVNLATELAAVVTALRGITGVESASADPSEVIAPGVVVQLDSIEPGTLGSRVLHLQLLLVVPDTGPAAPAQLAALLSSIETWATADGPILARSVVLPANPTTPLPGLVFPLDHYATEG